MDDYVDQDGQKIVRTRCRNSTTFLDPSPYAAALLWKQDIADL